MGIIYQIEYLTQQKYGLACQSTQYFQRDTTKKIYFFNEKT